VKRGGGGEREGNFSVRSTPNTKGNRSQRGERKWLENHMIRTMNVAKNSGTSSGGGKKSLLSFIQNKKDMKNSAAVAAALLLSSRQWSSKRAKGLNLWGKKKKEKREKGKETYIALILSV